MSKSVLGLTDSPQNCRFHFYWPHEAGEDGIDQHEEHERIFAAQAEDYGIRNGYSTLKASEFRRAFRIFWDKREKSFCQQCEPLLLPDINPESDRCHCTFYNHFVGERWLCLPCFFKEEVDAEQQVVDRIMHYDAAEGTYLRVSQTRQDGCPRSCHQLMFLCRSPRAIAANQQRTTRSRYAGCAKAQQAGMVGASKAP